MKDIDIARSVELDNINNIANKIGVNQNDLHLYGNYMAKIKKFSNNSNNKGKLILVTAITPTKFGEGKSTITIGLADGLQKIGKNSMVCLREPSMGPVFGIKGGAAGGGYSQVVPMEDINLHFTGDMHAITSANNLICAAVDNHIHHDNELNIDINNIVIKRCLDVNDRILREVTIGQGSKINGVERKDGFDITVASEVMAVLCLSEDLEDFKKKIGSMIVAYNNDGMPIFVRDLNIVGSVATIMKDAIYPNLVQTLEKTPALIHGGPFANIAHGCNSIIATKLGLELADFVVTEAGFGSDLGFEKFLDIKSRMGNIDIDCVVLVATIKALKAHGEAEGYNGIDALRYGFNNLLLHKDIIKKSNLNMVVGLNLFAFDTKEELELFSLLCKENEIDYAVAKGFSEGSKGMVDLANLVLDNISTKNKKYFYDLEESIENKITKLATNVYSCSGVEFSDVAKEQIKEIKDNGFGKLTICIAKVPNFISSNGSNISKNDINLYINKIKVSSGAGFIVCYSGNVLTMPGLSKDANLYNVDIIDDEIINLS